MTAIVKAENIAASGMPRTAGSRYCVRGNGIHALDQPLTGRGSPVAGYQRPHYGTQAELTCDAREPGAAETPRRAKPFRRRVQGGGDRVLAAAQFFAGLRRREPEQILVRLRVIANHVPPGGYLSNQARTFLSVVPNQEKCRARVVAIEKIEQSRRHRRIRAVIEGDRQFTGRGRTPSRRAEQLRARIGGAIGGQPSSGSDDSGSRKDPRIHAAILARAVLTSTCESMYLLAAVGAME